MSTHAAGVEAVDGVQVPVPFGKAVVQFFVVEPQAVLVSASQALPLAWKPAAHWNPQLPLVQAADPFAGAGHGVHEVPQVCGLESDAQEALHKCVPALQEVSTQVPAAELHAPWPPEKATVQSTAPAPQAVSVLPAQAVPCTCWPAGQSHLLFTQRVDAQSAPVAQCRVAPQGVQVPPQSTSLSVPLRSVSVQVAAAAGWQTPCTQAKPNRHGLLASSQMEHRDDWSCARPRPARPVGFGYYS